MKYPVILALILLAVMVPKAEAAPVLIGWGEKISEASPLPTSWSDGSANYKLGFYYNSLRLFFVPVVTWGGHYVLFSESSGKTSYAELTDEQKKMLDASMRDWKTKGGIGVL
jgi:hypothetical protein